MPPNQGPTPFSDPLLPQLELSRNPYYTQLHHDLRAYCRSYVTTELLPYAQQWEEAGQVPEEVRLRHCQRGFAVTHPVHDPADTGGIQLPNGVPLEKWDTW